MPIIVDGTRAVEYLILAVAIHIPHPEVVVALTVVCRPLHVAVEEPAELQFSVDEIIGCQCHARIIPAAHHH